MWEEILGYTMLGLAALQGGFVLFTIGYVIYTELTSEPLRPPATPARW